MWVFTTTGFISALFKDSAIQAWSRDRKSLEPLAKQTWAAIVATPPADYPNRIAIANRQFTSWVPQVAPSVNYKNFKSEIADIRGYGFAKPLNQVWSVMHKVEDGNARNR